MYLKKLLMAAVTAVIVGIGIASPSAVMAAPQVMADGGIFDAEYYAAANPDVAAIFGTDANSLYIHYVNFGAAEGRLPYAAGAAVVPQAGAVNAPAAVSTTESFDAAYYAMANPDVVSVLGTDPGVLYNHYISYGKKEGRRASAGTAAVSVQKAATVKQTAVQPAAQQQVAQPVVQQQVVQPVTNGDKTVYWTEKGKSYHSSTLCPSLSRSKNISSGPLSRCPKSDPCDRCM